jgi:hypothetical protein
VAEVLQPGSPLRLLAPLRADLLGAALQRPATAPLVRVLGAGPRPWAGVLARWKVGDDAVHDTGMRVTPAWTSVRPLGDGRDDPVVLFTSGAVGLVVPRDGARPPRARLHRMPPPKVSAIAPDTAFRHLCDALAGGELAGSDRRSLPEGAFTGDPCS